jgi:uncharacterized membrane protein
MGNITGNFQASVPGGPALNLKLQVPYQSYDVTSATIAASASNVALEIQPSTTVGDVVFVVVYSDQYGAGLTYKVDGGTTAIALDAPHIMMGGAVAYMNSAAPPQKLTFTSTLTKDANVQVVVGRKS